jgi:hypothetical protein
MQTVRDDKSFDKPVLIRTPSGVIAIDSARQAADMLADVDWPGPRDDLHSDALETCLKVLDGHRSTEDARTRLVEAVTAAGLTADGDG